MTADATAPMRMMTTSTPKASVYLGALAVVTMIEVHGGMTSTESASEVCNWNFKDAIIFKVAFTGIRVNPHGDQ